MVANEACGNADGAPIHPRRLIASLHLGELVELEGVLGNPLPNATTVSSWQGIVTHERIQRERVLGEMLVNRPKAPECPAYDAEQGPYGYISQARQVNRTENLTGSDYKRRRGGRRFADTLAAHYLGQHYDHVRMLDLPDTNNMLQSFLASNIHYTIDTSRVFALRAYEATRGELIRRHLPDAGDVSLPTEQFLSAMTGVSTEQVAAAKNAIEQLPYSAPLPDFFRMPTEVQQRIVTALGDEWLQLCRILRTVDEQLLQSAHYHTPALAYLPVRALEHVINSTPARSHLLMCKEFLRSPLSFPYDSPSTRKAEKVGKKTTRKTTESKPTPHAIPHQIRALLQDPRVNSKVYDLMPGATLPITAKNTALSAPAFDHIIDIHLQLIGLRLCESAPDVSKEKQVARTRSNIGQLLRKSHVNDLVNLSITRLAIADQELEKRYHASPDYDGSPLLAVTNLLIRAEHRHRGRMPVPLALRLLVGVCESNAFGCSGYRVAPIIDYKPKVT